MTKVNDRAVFSRRSFILSAAAVGGGLAIGLPTWLFRGALTQTEDVGPEGVEVYNWIVIAPDNNVTIRIAQMEMGQGTMTAMAQLLAEELEVDWSKIKTEFISIATHLHRGKVFLTTETSASLGLRLSDIPLRTAGAQIRTMLIKAAARRLGASEAEFVAENSVVTHTITGRRLTYGELAADAAKITVPDPESVRLKESKDWKFLGKSIKRVDIPAKIDGSALFGIDVRLPGMKYAALVMSPVFGGTLKSYDSNTALSFPGVRKVVAIRGGEAGFVRQMDDAIAVVADQWWQAKAAVDAMPKEWDDGAWSTVDGASIFANLQTGLDGEPDRTLRTEGNVEAAMASAVQKLEAYYFVPYLEQATMEPMNCTALVTDHSFQVWVPTQTPEAAIGVAAKIAGMPVEKGELHCTLLGGGFGRRLECDVVSQAVQIARAIKGVPIKLLWTREDTMRHSFYRQASLSRLTGGIDGDGRVSAWNHRIVSQSEDEVRSTYGSDTLLYSIPNVKVEFSIRHSHVPEGSMRGVGFSINCFAVQSFIDELARAAGKDGYQLQRELLDPARAAPTVPITDLDDNSMTPQARVMRLCEVLDKAAEKANWGAPLGPNRGRGIAVQEQSGGFYAVVVEVTLDGHAWFKVDRVIVVGDPGLLANPDNARAQIEGSVAFGLTSAMYGEITVQKGHVIESNFNDYKILRIDEMPEVEVYWILGRHFWGGVSQAVVGIIPPALTNAIYDAGGPRIRSLPLKNHKIRKRDLERRQEDMKR
jgi:isoquinoline 1-oxidoreductase subunit beta